jgi:hypothetical protein
MVVVYVIKIDHEGWFFTIVFVNATVYHKGIEELDSSAGSGPYENVLAVDLAKLLQVIHSGWETRQME